MKKALVIIAAIAFATASAFAQTPTPTPVDDGVVKVATDLIQLDVTVTDSKGKVVTGLSASDFEVFENGEKQTISNFAFQGRSLGGVSIGDANGQAQQTQPTAQTPPRSLAPAAVRLSISIIIDDLNLSFGSIYYTKRALRKFVDEQMQPNDLVAIIRTAGGAGGLQQFTSDKRLLHAAIEKIRWNPFGGSFDSLASVGQNNSDISERFNRESTLIASGRTKTTTIINSRDYETEKRTRDTAASKNAGSQEDAVYAQTSLGIVKFIVSGMAKLPGRKTVMLFSDGIAMGNDTSSSPSNIYAYLKNTAEAAKRSSVVVYTFDTKGMRSMSIQASDNTYEIVDGHRGLKERERTKDFKDSQEGLVYFAEQTGGKALINSDDLNGGIQRVLDEQTGYYLVAYVPETETDAGKRTLNKVEVKVNRPGLNVSYRSRYFNDNGTVRAAQPTAEKQIAEALMSPFTQSEIPLNINALYADDAADGAYIRSFLHIDARALTFTEAADGWKKATFDVVAVTLADTGAAVENTASNYTIKTKGATYEAMLKKGFVYVLMMPVKKPGVYQYRVALRDAGSAKLGSASQIVEVPDLGKGSLAISSIAVENVSPAIWQNISQGKVGANPGQIHVPSTLLYDTVLKQFPAGSVLRYGYEIYNAKQDGTSRPQIETQFKILQNDTVVTEGSTVKLDTAAQADPKHLRVSNAVTLKDTLAPGDYVLQVIVTDKLAKRTAYQLFPFESWGDKKDVANTG